MVIDVIVCKIKSDFRRARRPPFRLHYRRFNEISTLRSEDRINGRLLVLKALVALLLESTGAGPVGLSSCRTVTETPRQSDCFFYSDKLKFHTIAPNLALRNSL